MMEVSIAIMELTYDPAISLLGTNLEEVISVFQSCLHVCVHCSINMAQTLVHCESPTENEWMEKNQKEIHLQQTLDEPRD